jgi:DNA polymerase-1
MKKLFILDAINFLFRSYYAIPPMTTPNGVCTNALYGFIRSLGKILADFSPDYIVAVFDGPDNKKSRTALYEFYKSHRKGMPEDLFPQLGLALDFCSVYGIPVLEIPGVEADDVIGSIVRWASTHSIHSYICTSDKDLCQLVSPSVSLVHAHKDNLLVDSQKVEELFGVKPSQIVDYLALIGDASDNIPGIEGIGPKTAVALLQEFSSLETILKHADSIPGKKGELLRKGADSALLSKQLALLNFEVEIPQMLAFYEKKDPNLSSLKEFYQEYHFLSLLKDLQKEDISEKTEESPLHYHLITSSSALAKLSITLKTAGSICIDTETTELAPMQAQLVGVGLGIEPGEAWYVPLNSDLPRKEVLEFLKSLLSDPNIQFYGHNIKYDLHVLLNEGLPIPKIDFDTMLASYLLAPQTPRHGLDTLSLEHFQKVKIPIEELIGKGKHQISMQDVPLEKIKDYCCEDVDYTMRLKKLFEGQLKDKKLLFALEEIELPLILPLLSMERSGIFLDVEKLKAMSESISHKISLLTKKIYDFAEEEFNINSPKQLSHILFEKLKLHPPKKTQSGFSTAADVLEELQDKSEIIPWILEFRQLEKLRSTYIDSLPTEINPKTGRIHCTFNQSVAATGRLSCQNPNLQNIPVRSEEGRKIRECFKPEKHGWSYLSADYSQIELRLLAHLSDDPKLLKAFEEGEDIHSYTASLIFNVPLKEVTSELRYKAKAVNFGILYGQQAFGLSKETGVSLKEAAHFIDTYFQRYDKVKDYIESCKESARKEGCSFTMTGRRRPIPDINSKNPVLRSLAERLAVNTPLQGSAADLIKLAMIQIHTHWTFKESFAILQIHDELVFEAKDSEIEKLGGFVKEKMESALALKVPLVVDISVGKNWGEC